jgi:pyruvate dehydrogenase E2 component (dihydrolipoamide acetyltransferase)
VSEPRKTTPMVLEFRLPDLGEGLSDAELISWCVQVGDTVGLNDPIAEVETAKAQVELPSPFAGQVTELLAQPGDTIPVGAPIIRISAEVTAGDMLDPLIAAQEAQRQQDSPPAPQRQSVLVGYGPDDATANGGGAPRRRRGSPDAKPSARKLARELGIDLTEVTGTGVDGVITVDDVAARTHRATAEESPETRVKVSGVRKRIAEAMATSARTIPSVTEFLTVDVTRAMELLERLRALPSFAGVRVTPLSLLAKITLVALADHPELNACWDEAGDEIVTKHYVNLGIAVATDRGLVVPNIKAAQRLSLRELCREIDWCAEAAREATASPVDLTQGTFTISNVGVFGVDAGTPIINPGEAAILALGAVAQRPWVVDGAVVPRLVTTLALSFDHRIVDGEQGSRFLTAVGSMMSDPLTLLGGV